MRATLCLAVLAFAGCKSGDGFAVDLTIAFDNISVTDAEVAQMTRLHVVASNAESFTTDVNTAGSFHGRSGTIRYKPGAHTTGTLTLTIAAFDGTTEFASGHVDVRLSPGATSTASMTLYGQKPSGVDAGADMLSVADMPPFDFAGSSGCNVDTDCASGYYCNPVNACVPVLGYGGSCTRDTQCVSKFCADGVCCDQRCGGTCQACNSSGTCKPIAAMMQPAGGHGTCTTDGTSCGGYCDGTNTAACFYPSASTSCGGTANPGTCSNGTCTCPPATVMCAMNGNRCTSTSFNNYDCDSTGGMCSGATPNCNLNSCGMAPPPQIVSSSPIFGYYMGQDPNNVYVSVSGATHTIVKVPKNHNTQTTWSVGGADGGVAADGVNVYWCDGNNIYQLPATSSSATGKTQLAGSITCQAVTVDATYVYWTDPFTTKGIGRVPISGTPTQAKTLLPGSNPVAIISDGTYLYWTQSSGSPVMRAAVDGTGSTPLVTGASGADQIARDAQFLYFDASDPNTAGQLIAYKAPISGGAAIPLLKGLTGGISLGVTNSSLFVLDTNAGVYKVPLCGGSPLLVYSTTNYLSVMVVDGQYTPSAYFSMNTTSQPTAVANIYWGQW
jgi:hypothetical protein